MPHASYRLELKLNLVSLLETAAVLVLLSIGILALAYGSVTSGFGHRIF